MGRIKEFLDDIDPSGTPGDHERFLRLAFRAFFLAFVVSSFGLFKWMGIHAYVRADEVDDKVQAAVEPLRSEIGKIAKAQEDQDAVLKSIRIDQLESKLRELQIIKCRIAFEDSERLDVEIQAAQRQHRALTGERYDLPPCKRVP